MKKLLENYRIPISSFCLGVLLTTFCIWGYISFQNKPSEAKGIEITRSEASISNDKMKSAFIAGAVNKEGSFELREGEDILSFVENNIGFREDADIEVFKNMISNSSDSFSLIYVPFICKLEPISEIAANENTVQIQDNTNPSLISVNNATKNQLESLPGIGSTYAERIINGRPYAQLDDIKKIKGIGDRTFEKIRLLICL